MKLNHISGDLRQIEYDYTYTCTCSLLMIMLNDLRCTFYLVIDIGNGNVYSH